MSEGVTAGSSALPVQAGVPAEPRGAGASAEDPAWARAVAAALSDVAAQLAPVPTQPTEARASVNWRSADAPVTAPNAATGSDELVDGGPLPSRLTLRCLDETLGAIDVRVERRGTGLAIAVDAEMPGVAALLQGERSALTYALAARGLEVSSLTVGQSPTPNVGTAVAKTETNRRLKAEPLSDRPDRRTKRSKLDIVG